MGIFVNLCSIRNQIMVFAFRWRWNLSAIYRVCDALPWKENAGPEDIKIFYSMVRKWIQGKKKDDYRLVAEDISFKLFRILEGVDGLSPLEELEKQKIEYAKEKFSASVGLSLKDIIREVPFSIAYDIAVSSQKKGLSE